MAKLNHGDKIKLVHEDGTVEYGEFHRYGASRHGAIAFFNGSMRFVDEQALIAVNNKCVNCVQVKAVPLKRFNDNQLFLYHGSGKKFDVFSNEFNGSGVGNNGYGYGIYLTDSKKSAKMWASHLETQSSVLIDGIKPSENVEEFLYRAVKLYGNKTDILLHVLKSNLDSLYKNNKITGDEYNFIKTANKLKLTRGRFVYEVEIKGDDFLLWKSLPTTEQLNKVSEQLSSEKLGVISIDKDIKVNNRMIRNGEDLYLSIGLSPKETSFFLDRCGIDGIKYYEDNCANYVIFNLNSIIIKKKVNF